MPKFSAHLSFLYTQLPFLERIAAAADRGFQAVEYMTPYEVEPERIRQNLDRYGMRMALINAPAGNWAAGERGLSVLKGRDDDFATAIEAASRYAVALGCTRINVLSGINASDEPRAKTVTRLVERMQYAADAFAVAGLDLLLEPINRFDMPGFFVNSPEAAVHLLDLVERDNAKLQYDIYHAQRTSGELTGFLRVHIERIGHIQIADNPGRHEPGTGEISYRFLLEEIDRLDYRGWVGLEYIPLTTTDESFAWIHKMGFDLG